MVIGVNNYWDGVIFYMLQLIHVSLIYSIGCVLFIGLMVEILNVIQNLELNYHGFIDKMLVYIMMKIEWILQSNYHGFIDKMLVYMMMKMK